MSYDIFHYYNQIREIINNKDENILSDVNIIQDLVSKFDLLINEIQSFLIYSYDYYYGYFLINLKFHYRFQKSFLAGVTLSPGFPVLMINPLGLGEMPLKEIIFILCHEIEHLVLAHHIEVLRLNKSCDPKTQRKLNIAFDASVNDRLIDVIENGMDLLQCPSQVVTSKTIEYMTNKNVLFNQHFLYYYELLKDEEVEGENEHSDIFDDIEYEIDFGDDSNEGQGESNDNQDGQQNGTIQANVKLPKFSINSDNSATVNINDNMDSIDDMSHMLNSGLNEESAQDILKNFIDSTTASMSEKARSLFESKNRELIDKLKDKPIISWKKELKRFLGNVPFGQRKTMMRLNRRQPLRLDLSGKMTDKTYKLVLAIDTSGSMSSKELSIVLNEISNIVKTTPVEITIIESDAIIQKVYKVKNINQISYDMHGRGGTCFNHVIEYVNQNKYYRDAVLIYFTDGYGEKTISRPQIYRMLWFVFGNFLSVTNKYGSAIYLDPITLKVDSREKQ